MPGLSSFQSLSRRLLSAGLIFLVASAAYLYTFPQPNVLYAVIVLLHAVVGAITTSLLVIFLYSLLRQANNTARIGWLLLLGGGIIGLVLFKTGTPRSEWNLLYAHILILFAGVGILFAEWAGRHGWSSNSAIRVALSLVVIAALGFGARYLRESRWLSHARIQNPTMPPDTMNGEGDGPEGPFFPSSAQVYGHQKIPS